MFYSVRDALTLNRAAAMCCSGRSGKRWQTSSDKVAKYQRELLEVMKFPHSPPSTYQHSSLSFATQPFPQNNQHQHAEDSASRRKLRDPSPPNDQPSNPQRVPAPLISACPALGVDFGTCMPRFASTSPSLMTTSDLYIESCSKSSSNPVALAQLGERQTEVLSHNIWRYSVRSAEATSSFICA
jgi:hypothetical protein